MSTLRGHTVQEKFPYNPLIWNNFLPIYPHPPNTPGGVQLYLGGQNLPQLSYVKVEEQHIVHTDMLDRFYRQPVDTFYLDTEYLNIVKECLRLPYRKSSPISKYGEMNTKVQTFWPHITHDVNTNIDDNSYDDNIYSDIIDCSDDGITTAGTLSHPHSQFPHRLQTYNNVYSTTPNTCKGCFTIVEIPPHSYDQLPQSPRTYAQNLPRRQSTLSSTSSQQFTRAQYESEGLVPENDTLNDAKDNGSQTVGWICVLALVGWTLWKVWKAE